MFTEEQKVEIREYLSKVEGRVYIGCDSVRFKKYNTATGKNDNWAKYAVALAVHINNSNGCKAFYFIESSINHDAVDNKPRLRLMSEVERSIDCYLEFEEDLIDREVQIHLDVNPNVDYASNAVAKQAVGWVKGMTGIDAEIKPCAYAGSYLADFIARGKSLS